jgi:hypothetical protein
MNSDQKLKMELAKARAIFCAAHESIRQDLELSHLLATYSAHIVKTQNLMRECGVISNCTRCALEGPGSCCFEGIESGYDSILLLINLLLGKSLPDQREVSGSCFFVGSRGCKLVARYYFCVHYLCRSLQEAISQDGLAALTRSVGEELSAGWNVEQALRLWLQQQSVTISLASSS